MIPTSSPNPRLTVNWFSLPLEKAEEKDESAFRIVRGVFYLEYDKDTSKGAIG